MFKNSGLFTFGKGLVSNATGFSAGKTVLKSVAVAGITVVNGIKERTKNNKASKVGGEGKTVWAEIAGIITGAVILIVTVYAFFTGQIDLNELIEANRP